MIKIQKNKITIEQKLRKSTLTRQELLSALGMTIVCHKDSSERCNNIILFSLRGRRLEVAGERENGRSRGRHARGDSRPPVFSCAHYFQAPATRVSPSRAPVFSCAHYFQAPATQAKFCFPMMANDQRFLKSIHVSRF